MTRHRILRSAAVASLALAIADCSLLPHHTSVAKFTPQAAGPSPSLVQAAMDEGYYGDAVKAIEKRDYARALDLLQAARARTPDDVRVLNAFGVVYDKLGRFDLSARYYALARVIDPDSTIVANNQAYSRVLQSRAGEGGETPVQVASATPRAAPAPLTAAGAPAAIRTASLDAAPVQAASMQPVSFDQAMLGQVARDGAKALTLAPTPATDLTSPHADPVQTVAMADVSADDAQPVMGRVVADGPGVLRLEPTPRVVRTSEPAGGYRPASTMTLAEVSTDQAGRPATQQQVGGIMTYASSGVVRVAPGVLRIASAPRQVAVAVTRAPGLTGYPLAVIDASGRANGSQPALTRLASLGWTTRIAPSTPSREHSYIYYEPGDLAVAQGLAHTLRMPVQIAECERACRGVTLVVGADAPTSAPVAVHARRTGRA
jgi:hypothetical protein